MYFGTCCKMLREMLPGANATLVRDLRCMRMRLACLALASAVDKENPLTQAARDIGMSDYEGAIVAAAEDPASACKQNAAHELQYLTVVVEGFTMSFCCRRSDSIWFGMNHEWPKDRGSDHWACPV